MLTAADVLADAAARIVRAEEAIEDGDHEFALTTLADLKHDIVVWSRRYGDEAEIPRAA
jgi:hypothetical protein